MKIIHVSVRPYPNSPSIGAKWITVIMHSAKLDAVLKSVQRLDAGSGIAIEEVRAHDCSGGWTERRAGMDFDVTAVHWVKITLRAHKSWLNETVKLLHRVGQVSPDGLRISAVCTLVEILQEDQSRFHAQN